MNKLVNIFFFLTVSLLPSYLIRCKNFSACVSPVPFTLLEILILLTFSFWFISVYSTEGNLTKFLNRLRSLIPRNFLKVIFLFLIAATISIFVASDISSALGIYKAYFIEPFLLFVVALDILKTTKNIQKVILPLLVCAFVVSFVAISEKIIGFNPGNTTEFLDRGRVSAFYTTSNAVGLLLGPLLIIALGSFLINKKFRNFYAISLVLTVVSLLVSGSRGAMVAVGAGLVVFLLLVIVQKFKSNFLPIFTRIIPILAGSVLLFNCLFLFNINDFLKINSENKLVPALNQRLCLWQGTTNFLNTNPIFGAGLASFSNTNSKFRTCDPEEITYPHNIILNFWTETGLLGVLSFCLLLVGLLYTVLKVEKLTYLHFGLAASLVVILIHGLVDVPYFKNDLSVEFWLIAALVLYLTGESRGQQSL